MIARRPRPRGTWARPGGLHKAGHARLEVPSQQQGPAAPTRPPSARVTTRKRTPAPHLTPRAPSPHPLLPTAGVRAGAAPHSMPSQLPRAAGARPHQPLPAIVNGEGQDPEWIAARMVRRLRGGSSCSLPRQTAAQQQRDRPGSRRRHRPGSPGRAAPLDSQLLTPFVDWHSLNRNSPPPLPPPRRRSTSMRCSTRRSRRTSTPRPTRACARCCPA